MTPFDRVKLLCKKRGLSIVELEEKLGFSRNSLYSWKINNPSVDKLEKVADFFHVTTDFLLGRESVEPDNRSQLIAAHIDDDVTEEEMEDIIKYINFLKSKHDM